MGLVYAHEWLHLCCIFVASVETIIMFDCYGKQEDAINITANSLHPGAILTNLFRHMRVVNGNRHITFLLNAFLDVTLPKFADLRKRLEQIRPAKLINNSSVTLSFCLK